MLLTTFFICLQEFISSACIEHLDFLDVDVDIGQFKQFTERDKGKQFHGLTDIPKIAKVEFTETWMDDVVSCFLRIKYFVAFVLKCFLLGWIDLIAADRVISNDDYDDDNAGKFSIFLFTVNIFKLHLQSIYKFEFSFLKIAINLIILIIS